MGGGGAHGAAGQQEGSFGGRHNIGAADLGGKKG